jgi:hypothetical protein
LSFLLLQVFVHDSHENVDWGILAGYEDQKRQIEDTLLLALLHPGKQPALEAGTIGGTSLKPPQRASCDVVGHGDWASRACVFHINCCHFHCLTKPCRRSVC